MNLFVLALKAHVPSKLKRGALHSLFADTAAAFGVPMPRLEHLSFEEALELYAFFTKNEVEKRLRGGEALDRVRRALHDHALRLGSELRRKLRLKKREDLLAVGTELYAAIGIEFEGKGESFLFRSCYFSRFYSADVCRVMSALDEGIAEGLSGGGRLRFSHRITEGFAECSATFETEGVK